MSASFYSWLLHISPDGVLTAVVLAVQLFLVWRTYRLSREAEQRAQLHDRLSVRPALEFNTFGDSKCLCLTLSNFGVGPAKVLEQIFVVDGKEVRPGETPAPHAVLHTLMAQYGIGQERLEMISEFAPHSWMGAGKDWDCVRIALPGFTMEQTLALRNRIRIKISYADVYGQTFEVDSKFATPQRIGT